MNTSDKEWDAVQGFRVYCSKLSLPSLVIREPVRHLFQSFATDCEKLTKMRLQDEVS